MRSLERDGALRDDGTVVECAADSVPTSARQATLSRLAFLSEDALQVLRTSAVLGTTFAVGDVAVVLGLPVSRVVGPIDEARRAGLVVEAPEADMLRFQHDIVREAIYLDLPATVRRALHLDAGRALAAVGAPPGQVAAQMVLGARRGDEVAIRWVARTAEQASKAAPAVAADLLDRLVDLLEPDDPRHAVALADLGFNRLWSGQLELAEQAIRTLLGTATRPDDLGRVDRLLSRILTLTGRHDAALVNAERAVRRPGLSAREQALQLAELAVVTTSVDPARAGPVGDHAVEAARAAASPAALGRACSSRAADCYFRGYFEESLVFAAKVREAAVLVRSTPEATTSYVSLVARRSSLAASTASRSTRSMDTGAATTSSAPSESHWRDRGWRGAVSVGSMTNRRVAEQLFRRAARSSRTSPACTASSPCRPAPSSRLGTRSRARRSRRDPTDA